MDMRYKPVLFILFFSVLHCTSVKGTPTCPAIDPPPHGEVLRCTSAKSHLSVCTISCNKGYDIEGGSRLLCWCEKGGCDWRGKKPVCKATTCEVPNHDIGRIMYIDKWPGGFTGVMDIVDIPDIEKFSSGWSIVVVFDRPLGKNAALSIWNAVVVTSSYEKQTFTFLNKDRNADLSAYLPSRTISWSFVVTGVKGALPTAAYIGLYNRRIEDASCLKAPVMHEIEFVTSFASNSRKQECEYQETTTNTPTSVQPWRTTTVVGTRPVTSPTSLRVTSTPQPATTETSSAATTSTTTPTPTTTVAKTTTKSPLPTSKPKRKRRPRRRKKKTTTPAATTATTPTVATTTEKATGPGSSLEVKPVIPGENDTVLEKSGGRYCILQRNNGSYKTQEGWEDDGIQFFSGNAVLTVEEHLLDWSMLIIFDTPLEEVQVWSCTVMDKSDDGRMWTFGPHEWNLELYPGESDINFIAEQSGRTAVTPVGNVYLCSYAFAEGDAIVVSASSAAYIPRNEDDLLEFGQENENIDGEETDDLASEEDVVVIDAEKPKKWQKPAQTGKRCLPSAPTGVLPKRQAQTKTNFRPNKDGTKYNYNEAIHKSILFYEAQRAGKLPADNRIPWRGDSTLKDGCDIGVDLSGGWFDAGDHVKFHFPMASSVTVLAWGGILFRDAYKDAGELEAFLDSIKWPVDYLIKSHISKYEFVGQVGSGRLDHGTCGRPEEMRMPRKTYIIDQEHPGTELAAEVAAALAASHLLFKSTHPKLSRTCLKHAIELFEFADEFRDEYHNAIPDVKNYYFSYSGYDDELIWAAAWLYKATADQSYLTKARQWYVKLGGQYVVESEFSWDRKLIGAQILLANMTGDEIYRKPVEMFLENLLSAKATPKGLFWVRRWGPNRYAANVAFMALAASNLSPTFAKMDVYVEWARKQIHLLLGDIGRSYVAGFGKNPPENVHHRSSACKPFPALCNCQTFDSPTPPNFFTLYGALVGGPNEKEIYSDNRKVYEQTEVACDHNAGFQGAVAGLKHIAMKSRKPKEKHLHSNLRKWFV